MDLTADEIAGVVDLFGALPPATLREALAELAFKNGEDVDPDTVGDPVAEALDSYHLLEIGTETPLVAVGPAAFPTLPDHATDLPHILDANERSIDPDRLARAAERRFRRDAAAAIDAGDRERVQTLLDVSYELEAWGPVDLAETRDRLDDALEGMGRT
ncbi:MAG: hypothetical protein ABEI98_00525 [Halorhabdus sp.]